MKNRTALPVYANKLFLLLFFFLSSLFIIPHPVSASTTLYFGSIEKTYDDTGAVVEEKVYIPAGNSMAVKTTNYNLTPNTYNLSFLHSDHIGSTVLVTTDDGTVESSLIYYPYGNSTDLNNESRIMNQDTDKLYTSQRKDTSTNLYFYNARYYNPTTGRFLSADKAEGPNRYAYVGNNPVARNDPSGNQAKVIDNETMTKALENKLGMPIQLCIHNTKCLSDAWNNNKILVVNSRDQGQMDLLNNVIANPNDYDHCNFIIQFDEQNQQANIYGMYPEFNPIDSLLYIFGQKDQARIYYKLGATGNVNYNSPSPPAQIVQPTAQSPPKKENFIWPTQGYVTSEFGEPRGLGLFYSEPHTGIDIGAPMGTQVHASRTGVISEIGTSGPYGNSVKLNHGDGYQTFYAHLSKFGQIQLGLQVPQGFIIGYVGSTGNSTGPHLHFEIEQNGTHQNPRRYLAE